MTGKRKSSLGRKTSAAKRMSQHRLQESEEQRSSRLNADSTRHNQQRAAETEEQRCSRLNEQAQRQEQIRANETEEQRQSRMNDQAQCQEQIRANETEQQINSRLHANSTRNQQCRLLLREQQHRLANRMALAYQPILPVITGLGAMNDVCDGCHAVKFKGEPKGMCCSGKKVILPQFPSPPSFLRSLLDGSDVKSAHFLNKIRYYNGAFQMTSFGHTPGGVTGWNPTFKVQGQVYHRIGTLLPGDATAVPKYLQIYFLDSHMAEVDARAHPRMDRNILLQITAFLHENNTYIRDLKTAKETLLTSNDEHENCKIVIREDKRPVNEHARRFNAQASTEVAILMENEPTEHRDIVLRLKTGGLQRISELHRSYDTLQYPLIFLYGTDGYNIYLRSVNGKKITQQQYYSSYLQIRPGNFIYLYGRLYQQLLVDWYAKMETERLLFIRREQKTLRADNYLDLQDSLFMNDGNPQNVGQRVVLPSTFVGGPRYMHEKQSDAMTYVRKFGCPDLFLTITCNPHWEEIVSNLGPSQTASDRPDLICRVFHLKLKKLMDMVKKGIFGEVRAWLYTIEYQKRGLPHAHILVWLLSSQKNRPNDIDFVVSAEIPDPIRDPELHSIILTHMIHGPCGAYNLRCPCMKVCDFRKVCQKRFPKSYRSATEQGQDGYPKYKRRHSDEGGHTGETKVPGHIELVTIGNEWVVPYNPYLLRQFNCHLNVEICNSIKSIKYVLKYVHKGTDQAVFEIQTTNGTQNQDEVSNYQNGRYIGSIEAAWRILGFDMHERFPPVERLAVHLENGQRVYFREQDAVQRAAGPPPETTLTAFFKLCTQDELARSLLYTDLPEYFTWDKGSKKWKTRMRGTAIGRMYTVSPRQGECYFVRLLLNVVRGPQSFDSLKTVDDEVCATYREACQRCRLLANDHHLHLALEEASQTQLPRNLRDFFAIIITSCEPSNPNDLWVDFRDKLAEDILFQHRQDTGNEDAPFTDLIYNEALCLIEDQLLLLSGKPAEHHALPPPIRNTNVRVPREYLRETDYDHVMLSSRADDQYKQFTADQKEVCDDFISMVQTRLEGGQIADKNIIFLDAPGGTGKTFVINLILAKIRSNGKIAIATASSGIAATLLEGGRTLHSTFKIPINTRMMDSPTCSIKKGSTLAQIIKDAAAIIVDEAPMNDKSVYEALDRTLQDIMDNDKPMGGIPTLLSGDFRQILPVVKRGTRADIVKACLKKSRLWHHIKVMRLTINMRAFLSGNLEAARFASLLLDIGNGNITPTEQPDTIEIPSTLGSISTSLEQLKEFVYPDLLENCHNTDWLSERALISPLNENVNKVNAMLMGEFPGVERTYMSVDTAENDDESVLYPTEFLNSIELSGLPPHILTLKVGAPIIILRSLHPPKLTNGTRCVVTRLQSNVIEAEISCGPYKGESVVVPRIPLKLSDSTLPFTFTRLQFPIKPSFAMTINKSQGQTFKYLGGDLSVPCFTHGMFYVAASRTGNASTLSFLAPEDKTRNVVYKEVFN